MAAEYEVNIKINSRQIERELKNIDKIVSNIGKPKGGGSRRKPGIAGLLPSSADLKAAENGITRLTAKTKTIQNIQDKFSERRVRSLIRSNALNEKELRLNKQLTAEARARLRLLSQAGAKGFEGTRPQGRQLANDINARVKAQDKRARLLNKINEMEAKGLNVEKLRKQLNKATTEQSARRFASADKEFNILRKTIELEKSKLRILKDQQKNFAASPVRGTVSMAGSPAQIEAIKKVEMAEIRAAKNAHFAELKLIQKRQKVQMDNIDKELAKDIKALNAFDKKLAASDDARAKRLAGAEIPGLGRSQTFGPGFPTGGASLPIKGSIAIPDSPIAVQAAKKTNLRALKVEATWAQALGDLQETAAVLKSRDAKLKQSWNVALGTLQDTAKLIRIRSQQAAGGLTGQSSPIGGAANIPGSPAALRRGRRNKRLEQVGLGAGFPLLFGGGAGSVLGGAAGGLTGSFGAQIAFSAIGQQIDQMVASVIKAGKAFTSVGGAADFMAEKSLFSSDSMQFRIEKLIEEGNVTEAAALMTQEMAKQVGGSGLKSLKDLGTEATKMGKLFGTVMLRIQAFMAQALTPLIKLINSAIGGMVAQNQLDQMLAEAGSPERRAAILARSQELRGTKKQGRKSSTRGDFTMEMLQTLQKDFPAIIPEGAAIVPTELETLQAVSTRKKEKRKSRLPELEAERAKLESLLQLEAKRFDFQLKGDKAAVARLQANEKIAGIFEKIRGIQAAELTDKERRVALQGQSLEIARVNLELGFQLAQIEKDRVAQLDELRIKTEEQNPVYQRQLELAQGIADTFGTTMMQAFDAMVAGTERFDVAIRKLVAGALNDMARKLFQIFVIEQAIRSIGAAFAPPPIFGSSGGVDQFGRGTLGPNYGIRQYANGGNPPVGRPSIVGERGPELFVPRTAGTIIPNHAMGGGASVTVNVDASGSSVEGDGDQAAQLGKMLGAAVQAELVKQKRPGGLLAS